MENQSSINQPQKQFEEKFQIDETDENSQYEYSCEKKNDHFNQLNILPITKESSIIQKKIYDKYRLNNLKIKTQIRQDQSKKQASALFKIQSEKLQRKHQRFPTTMNQQLHLNETTNQIYLLTKSKKLDYIKDQEPQKKNHNKIKFNERMFTKLNNESPQQNSMDRVDLKKNKFLQKFKQDKNRMMQNVKNNESELISKYATKFHINKKICKQIINEDLQQCSNRI